MVSDSLLKFKNVPEVLNVHVNENNKKIYFFSKDFFFSSSEKLTFEKENDFLKYFFES